MRQKNERNIDLIHSSRTRDGGGGEERKEKHSLSSQGIEF